MHSSNLRRRLVLTGFSTCTALVLAGCGGGASGVTAASSSVAPTTTATSTSTTSATAGTALAAAAAPEGIPASCNTARNANMYVALARRRPDLLRFYAKNGWDAQTHCHQIDDKWLSHGPDGKPATTAAAFVAAPGWPTPSGGQ
ncbi:MAG: hypothetical protein ACR2JY_18535 [Chloroflexota bacterium]